MFSIYLPGAHSPVHSFNAKLTTNRARLARRVRVATAIRKLMPVHLFPVGIDRSVSVFGLAIGLCIGFRTSREDHPAQAAFGLEMLLAVA